mmetsp:Transcript_12291/g.35526  ORF Transcript_12291/g.35526 Transcript_12291/m.35526 type:complete len:93 (+) Transcript_12291:889-1167(+)
MLDADADAAAADDDDDDDNDDDDGDDDNDAHEDPLPRCLSSLSTSTPRSPLCPIEQRPTLDCIESADAEHGEWALPHSCTLSGLLETSKRLQ